jgi:hypothetical protein
MKSILIVLVYMSFLLMPSICIAFTEDEYKKNATMNSPINETNESANVVTNVTTNVIPSVTTNIQTNSVNIFLIANMTEFINIFMPQNITNATRNITEINEGLMEMLSRNY